MKTNNILTISLLFYSREDISDSGKNIWIGGHSGEQYLIPFEGLFRLSHELMNARHLVDYFRSCYNSLQFLESLQCFIEHIQFLVHKR